MTARDTDLLTCYRLAVSYQLCMAESVARRQMCLYWPTNLKVILRSLWRDAGVHCATTERQLWNVPLVEFMYLVFTHMPGESYCRQLRYLLCLCYVFQVLINSLVCWFISRGPVADACSNWGHPWGARERSRESLCLTVHIRLDWTLCLDCVPL